MNGLSSWINKVKETAELNSIKTRMPFVFSNHREKGTTATSITNESEGSTIVNIGDFQTVADEDGLKNNLGCTTQYGSADLELGKLSSHLISAIPDRSKTRVILLISSLTISLLLVLCLILFFFI
jgi:hypothetical protein